jgi:hypothetical protein
MLDTLHIPAIKFCLPAISSIFWTWSNGFAGVVIVTVANGALIVTSMVGAGAADQ